jgi:hypothetical protein
MRWYRSQERRHSAGADKCSMTNPFDSEWQLMPESPPWGNDEFLCDTNSSATILKLSPKEVNHLKTPMVIQFIRFETILTSRYRSIKGVLKWTSHERKREATDLVRVRLTCLSGVTRHDRERGEEAPTSSRK